MSPKHKGVVVVLGMMGRTPFAGIAWQVLHYLEGFHRLGYEVYYVEDTGDWAYDPVQCAVTEDCSYAVEYIGRQMAWCAMPDRWAYRSGVDGTLYGPLSPRLSNIWERADVLVNLTGTTVLCDEHMRVPVRIYLETDPVLPEIEVAQGRSFTIDLLAAHTHHFTFGENVGRADCKVPLGQFRYRPTRQPVVLSWWHSASSVAQDGRFTTIGNWQQSGKDIEWNGDTYYWSKHHEFMRFLDLPSRTPQCLELALSQIDADARSLLVGNGWVLTDATNLSLETMPYHRYICESRGEFTVAKDQNVRLRSGWFSDRSACYLAAGKPVVTQSTGFEQVLPTGEGLFAFQSMEDILSAFDTIAGEYQSHSQAARELAHEYFGAEKVLAGL